MIMSLCLKNHGHLDAASPVLSGLWLKHPFWNMHQLINHPKSFFSRRASNGLPKYLGKSKECLKPPSRYIMLHAGDSINHRGAAACPPSNSWMFQEFSKSNCKVFLRCRQSLTKGEEKVWVAHGSSLVFKMTSLSFRRSGTPIPSMYVTMGK